MGKMPLFLPSNTPSPLLRPLTFANLKIPANTELAREIEIAEKKQQELDNAFLQSTYRAKEEAKASVERALSARKSKRSSKKRKVPRFDTGDEDAKEIVPMKELERFAQLMGRDKRGSKEERQEWPGIMKLVSSFSSCAFYNILKLFEGL